MKKISKFLVIIIISILLFDFILSNSYVCYAIPPDGGSNAEFAVGNEVANLITNLGGGIISILLWLPKLKATAILIAVDLSVTLLSKIGDSGGAGGGTGIFITPYDIFFNKFSILDINFFDIEGTSVGSIPYEFRTHISGWYYVMRILATAILLIILGYVGIRMAIASVAEEKAKYKKMLIDWCCGLALIFVMHYIAIFAIHLNNAIVNALKEAFSNVDAEGTIAGLALEALLGIGIKSIVAFLVFVGILAQTIFFFIAYFNRMLKIGFLILISPLITLTYSIDKMGDGKAQALGTWLKEFIFTIFIQPFHCIVYMAFINVAFELVGFSLDLNYINNLFSVNQLAQGFLAILCIKFINDGEKIVKKIFGFSADDSKTSFAGGAVATVAAVKTISNMGGKASNLLNNSKVSLSKFKEHYENDKPQLDKILGKGDKASSGGKDLVGSGADAAKNTIQKSTSKGGGSGRSTKKGGNIRGPKKRSGRFKSKTANKLADRVRQRANHLTVAAVAGMAAYATGSTDAFTAIGIGTAAGKSADSFFNKTSMNLINGDANSNAQIDTQEKAKLEENKKKLKQALDSAESTLENFDEIVDEYEKSTEKTKKVEELDEQIEDLQEKVNNTPKGDKNAKKQIDELKKLRAQRKKLHDEAMKLRKSAQEKDNGGKIGRALSEGKKSEEIKKDLEIDREKISSEIKKLENEIKTFWSQESIIKRLQDRHETSSKKDLDKKANEIQQRIASILRKRRNIDLAENSSDELPTDFITAEDTLAKSITKNIVNKAQYDYLSSGGVNTSEILKGGGLGEDEELQGLLSEYGSLLASNKFSENVDQSENLGFTENGYLTRVAQQIQKLHPEEA